MAESRTGSFANPPNNTEPRMSETVFSWSTVPSLIVNMLLSLINIVIGVAHPTISVSAPLSPSTNHLAMKVSMTWPTRQQRHGIC